jgi:excisionase family DNA binding protein
VNDLSTYERWDPVARAGADYGIRRTDRPSGGVPPVLLTVEQAATALSLSRSLTYELLRRGELESIRVGACRRIPRQALDEWIARKRAEAREQPPAIRAPETGSNGR